MSDETRLNYPIDHIGIVVPDLDAAIQTYSMAFPCKTSAIEELKDNELKLVFLEYANTKLELLSPTTNTSLLRKFLNKRGPGLHHICYQVQDIAEELARLSQAGYQLIDSQSRPGAHGQIAFLKPVSFHGVLVELLEL